MSKYKFDPHRGLVDDFGNCILQLVPVGCTKKFRNMAGKELANKLNGIKQGWETVAETIRPDEAPMEPQCSFCDTPASKSEMLMKSSVKPGVYLCSSCAEVTMPQVATYRRKNGWKRVPPPEPDLTKCPKCGGPAELGREFASMGSAEQARFFNEIYRVVISEYAHGLSSFQLNMALAHDDPIYSTDGGREIMSRIAMSINLRHRDLAQTLAAKKAERETETNLTKCPKCGGPADNGHDRELPPNPYLCSRCEGMPECSPYLD